MKFRRYSVYRESQKKISNGDNVVLDGSEGQVYVNPDEALQAEYEQKRVAYLEEKAALAQFVGKETKTADGVKVELCANIGKPEDALKVVECDGEESVYSVQNSFSWIVHRFLQKKSSLLLTEKVAETLEGKPVIIRTLDVGETKRFHILLLKRRESFPWFPRDSFMLKERRLISSSVKSIASSKRIWRYPYHGSYGYMFR